MEKNEDNRREPSRLETVLICQSIYSKQKKCLSVFTPVWEDALFIPFRQLDGFMKVVFDSGVLTVCTKFKASSR